MTGADLYFIRHGQTDWNASGRFQGISDIPLNDAGRSQSAQMAGRLADYLKTNETANDPLQMLSSPLLRARQTADIICSEMDISTASVSQEPALRELSFGEWEGMTTLEVKAAFPVARKARKADRWAFSPQGGEAPLSRVPELQTFIASLQHPTVVVTHTGVIRICLYLLGFLRRESALVEPISQDKVYLITNGSLAQI